MKKKNQNQKAETHHMSSAELKRAKIIRALLIIVICFCAYFPLTLGYMQIKSTFGQQEKYTESISKLDEKEIQKRIDKAKEYNQSIYNKQYGTGPVDAELLSQYDKVLNEGSSDIMGYVKIPKINVNLAIRHGTSNDVLAVSAGHWKESSLPVGGKNTRTVIEGHRGLSTALLFTRLDELKKGDMFYFKIYDRTLAYKVYKIEVIKPDETDRLRIIKGKDTATLVTCTPYMQNTHRLLITGKRVKYDPQKEKKIHNQIPTSWHEFLFFLIRLLIPLLILLSIIRHFYKKRKAKKNAKKNEKVNSKEDAE